MTDLHTHILPGLDDGAQTLEDSLAMAELALESGVTDLVATPHSNQSGRFENDDPFLLRQNLEWFQQILGKERLPLHVYLGMEIFSSEDLCQKIQEGKLIGLNNSRYYLVEFPFDEEPEFIGDQLERMLNMGAIPLLAHPERYFCVQDSPVFVYDWLQMGCLTQINKGSILGRFGWRAEHAAHELLRFDLVTCMASDAHSPYRRTTYLREAYQILEEYYGEDTAYRLTVYQPGKILRSQHIRLHGRRPAWRRRIF